MLGELLGAKLVKTTAGFAFQSLAGIFLAPKVGTPRVRVLIPGERRGSVDSEVGMSCCRAAIQKLLF